MKTYPIPLAGFASLDLPRHVFAADPAKKDGKTPGYWSIVENQRLQRGWVVQQLPPQQPPKITTTAAAGVT